MILFIEL